tara:strand:- start:1298 stop:2026 length:729 start_codon:yes stop_codon:yes gene_type:complete
MNPENIKIKPLTKNDSDDDISNYSDKSDDDSIDELEDDSDDDVKPLPHQDSPSDEDDSDDDIIPPPPQHSLDDEDDDDDDNKQNNLEDKNIDNQFPTFGSISDDDSDDDGSTISDDEYLQKFNDNNRREVLQNFYPELHQHNIDEIKTLSIITRDTNGKIVDPLHQTLPFITKYEKTRILGERAKQISSGAIPLMHIDNTIIDSYLIAEKEFNEKVIPFIIKRPLPSGGCEYWKLDDLEILV